MNGDVAKQSASVLLRSQLFLPKMEVSFSLRSPPFSTVLLQPFHHFPQRCQLSYRDFVNLL